MRRRASILAVSLIGLSAALAFFPGSPASAHVVKKVGQFQLTVGFGSEPVYTGFENSVQLILTDLKGRPVTNIGSLKVQVIYGSQKANFPLEPTFDPDTGLGTPGDYRAWFFPTAPGNYTFHFTGNVQGQTIDQSFTSSPTTFDEAVDPSSVEFPAKVPSNAEIAVRLGRELPRLDRAAAAAGTVERAFPAVQSRASSAHSTSSTALILAIAGLAVGAGGAVMGTLGFRSARAARGAARA